MAVLNLGTLRSELGLKIKKTSIPSARLDRWLNQGVDDVTRAIDADHLIDEVTLTAASGSRTYFVPDCKPHGIISVVDTTNDVVLSKIDEESVERIDPDRDDGGNARFYCNYGYSEVQAQPLSASTVDIVSASASDTTQAVRIVGLVDSVMDTESITITGTSVATSTKSFSAVYGVRKSATSAGKFTVNMNDASNTVISYIAPGALLRQYQPFRVWSVPTSADSLRVRFYRLPRPMVNVEDIPDVSSDQFHEAVLVAAAVRGHRDLFDHDLADEVLSKEWAPIVNQYVKQQGRNVTDRSMVIGIPAVTGIETMLGGRYGYEVDI